jgi:hypothetical protein
LALPIISSLVFACFFATLLLPGTKQDVDKMITSVRVSIAFCPAMTTIENLFVSSFFRGDDRAASAFSIQNTKKVKHPDTFKRFVDKFKRFV